MKTRRRVPPPKVVRRGKTRYIILTHSSYDLTLHSQLILKPPCDPVHFAPFPGSDEWRVFDPIPHVAAGEDEDENDGTGAPDDPRLDERQQRVP